MNTLVHLRSIIADNQLPRSDIVAIIINYIDAGTLERPGITDVAQPLYNAAQYAIDVRDHVLAGSLMYFMSHLGKKSAWDEFIVQHNCTAVDAILLSIARHRNATTMYTFLCAMDKSIALVCACSYVRAVDRIIRHWVKQDNVSANAAGEHIIKHATATIANMGFCPQHNSMPWAVWADLMADLITAHSTLPRLRRAFTEQSAVPDAVDESSDSESSSDDDTSGVPSMGKLHARIAAIYTLEPSLSFTFSLTAREIASVVSQHAPIAATERGGSIRVNKCLQNYWPTAIIRNTKHELRYRLRRRPAQ